MAAINRRDVLADRGGVRCRNDLRRYTVDANKVLQKAKQHFICRWEGEMEVGIERHRIARSPSDAAEAYVWDAVRRGEFDVGRDVHGDVVIVRDYRGNERSFEVAMIVDVVEVTIKPAKYAKHQLTLRGVR